MTTFLPAICTYCNKEYQANAENLRRPRKNGNFCTVICSVRMRWKLKGVEGHSNNVCEHCGKTFYRSPKHVARVKRIFCSVECRSKSHRGSSNPMYRGGPVECACPICGKNFVQGRCHVNRVRRPCCSRSCATKWLVGEGEYRVKNLGTTSCTACGKVMKNRASCQIGKPRCCSQKCFGVVHSDRVKGEGNGRYVHGNALSPYPRSFASAQKLVRKRDGNICQRCWTSDNLGRKSMDVHHIDYDKDNNELSNLVCLCRVCHGSMHGSKKRRGQLTRYWRKIMDAQQMRLGETGAPDVESRQATLSLRAPERIRNEKEAA